MLDFNKKYYQISESFSEAFYWVFWISRVKLHFTIWLFVFTHASNLLYYLQWTKNILDHLLSGK